MVPTAEMAYLRMERERGREEWRERERERERDLCTCVYRLYTVCICYIIRVQLKHYHASSKVVRRAEELYGKLKGLYMYPKLVPRPLKKKAVGGAGIRKRPPTMAEYLNTQVRILYLDAIVYTCTYRHTDTHVQNMFWSGTDVKLHVHIHVHVRVCF